MPKDAELIILTKENLSQYCSIPDHIYQKLEAGIITLTHFSDIVRVTALAVRGGLWLDATIFATGDFSYAFEGPFWSIRKPGSRYSQNRLDGLPGILDIPFSLAVGCWPCA